MALDSRSFWRAQTLILLMRPSPCTWSSNRSSARLGNPVSHDASLVLALR